MPINKKRKLSPKIVDCVFLGYAIHNVGYRFLIINSKVPDMIEGTIMESRDATFFESEFPMKNTLSTSSYESILPEMHELVIQANVETHVENLEEDNNIVTRKSKRRGVARSFGDDYLIYLMDGTPKTIEEVYSSLDANLLKEAVQSEMDSIISNGTWEVVDRPYGCKPVRCKWVFKKNLGLMVLLRSTGRGLWQMAITERR
jgi:hypothetical protein